MFLLECCVQHRESPKAGSGGSAFRLSKMPLYEISLFCHPPTSFPPERSQQSNPPPSVPSACQHFPPLLLILDNNPPASLLHPLSANSKPTYSLTVSVLDVS